MREIKFKGWNKATRKIINWNELLDMNLKNIFIMPEKNTGIILMQYTGLHDKNGKEIYEGDIVKGKYLCESNDSLDSNMKEIELIGKIIFKDGAFMVKCISGHIHYSKERAIFTLEYFHIKIEVIGDIYDNPELLKEE